MANTIRIKRSAVGGKVPTTSQLSLGELAINTTDGRLYTRKEVSGVASIVEIGAGGGGISGPILQSKQVIDSNVNMTLDTMGYLLAMWRLPTDTPLKYLQTPPGQ